MFRNQGWSGLFVAAPLRSRLPLDTIFIHSTFGGQGHFGLSTWVALLVKRYLSNTASFVVCVACRVKDHQHSLHYSPSLKKTCVRQVVLDKWFPLVCGTFGETAPPRIRWSNASLVAPSGACDRRVAKRLPVTKATVVRLPWPVEYHSRPWGFELLHAYLS